MQFLPATFAHAAKLAGLTKADICDPADAIPAAAAYVRSNGAPADWQRALYRYNPADWYPPLVMSWAQRYGYGALVAGRSTAGYPGLRADGVHRRAGPLLRGPLLRALPRRDRHRGALGTPVRAVAAGRVVLAGRVSDGAIFVEIEHGLASSRCTATSTQRSASAMAIPSSRGKSSASSDSPATPPGRTSTSRSRSGVPVDPLLILPVRP